MSGWRPLFLISVPILAVLVALIVMVKIIGTGDTTGGDKDTFPKLTPRLQVTATSAGPTETWISSAGVTPGPWPAITPQAVAKANRKDCNSKWVAYADPKGRFSICFPKGYAVTATQFAVEIDSDDSAARYLVGWNPSLQGVIEQLPSVDNCPNSPTGLPGTATSTFTQVDLAAGPAAACLALSDVGSNVHSLSRLAKDGSTRLGNIYWTAVFTDAKGMPATVRAVLKTLSIDYR